MPATPSIRRATADDIPVVTRFRRAMFEELDDFEPSLLDEMEAAFRAYAERAVPSEEYLGWIAEADGKAVAAAGLVFQTLPPSPKNMRGKAGYVLNVFVAPEWRRQGLATRLVEAGVAHCRELGLAAVVLHASEAGAKVYERLGFTPTSEMRLWL